MDPVLHLILVAEINLDWYLSPPYKNNTWWYGVIRSLTTIPYVTCFSFQQKRFYFTWANEWFAEEQTFAKSVLLYGLVCLSRKLKCSMCRSVCGEGSGSHGGEAEAGSWRAISYTAGEVFHAADLTSAQRAHMKDSMPRTLCSRFWSVFW